MAKFLYMLTSAWVSLFTSIVWVLTFGVYKPDWDYNYAFWHNERRLKQKMENTVRPSASYSPGYFNPATSDRDGIIEDMELAHRAHECDGEKL